MYILHDKDGNVTAVSSIAWKESSYDKTFRTMKCVEDKPCLMDDNGVYLEKISDFVVVIPRDLAKEIDGLKETIAAQATKITEIEGKIASK